ncbi:Arv1-like family-domain-containing protein, partial [Dichotomocladium elegans]
MPTCVECGASVRDLYTQYSKDNIRLTSCATLFSFCRQDRCYGFADKYIEHDFVIIFIDMLLHKPQVYRHLLLNRISQPGKKIEWFRLETYSTEDVSTFIQHPLHFQYLYILTLCIFGKMVYGCSKLEGGGVLQNPTAHPRSYMHATRYNYVSMALIISSFGKMLLILMVIWDYKQLEYSWLVSLIVFASNAEAL